MCGLSTCPEVVKALDQESFLLLRHLRCMLSAVKCPEDFHTQSQWLLRVAQSVYKINCRDMPPSESGQTLAHRDNLFETVL